MLFAMDGEGSVLPLSATMISPTIPLSRSALWAFPMHACKVSDSFRQGMTTETSTVSSTVRSPDVRPPSIEPPPLQQNAICRQVDSKFTCEHLILCSKG